MPDLSPTGDLQEVADRHIRESCQQWWCGNPRVLLSGGERKRR